MEDKQIVSMLFARADGAIETLSKRFGRQLLQIAKNILETCIHILGFSAPDKM